jgi:hypothetical protein
VNSDGAGSLVRVTYLGGVGWKRLTEKPQPFLSHLLNRTTAVWLHWTCGGACHRLGDTGLPSDGPERRRTMEWTRITDPEDAARLLPAWFSGRMVGLLGSFGLLLTTGDVVRCRSIAAAHLSSSGLVLLDVLLDSAGVPDGVDLAWRSKHFLGAPVPAATLATINLNNVVAIVEFTMAEFAETLNELAQGMSDAVASEVGDNSEAKDGRPAGGHPDPTS